MIEMTAGSGAPVENLGAIYEWGLTVIRAFQSAGNPETGYSALTLIARFFTLCGDPIAYLAILPIVFWCIDEKRGFRIAMAVFVSAGLNAAIKESLKISRPFYADPSVKLIDETGFSTPSAHAQNSAVLFPLLAAPLTARWARLAISLAFPLLIGLSRVYLGVHYPTDVLLGWTIGAIISIFLLFVLPSARPLHAFAQSIAATAEASERSLKTLKLAAAAFVALAMNATSGRDSSMGGALFGFAAGYILLTDAKNITGETPRFSAAKGTPAQKALRLVIGLAGVALLYAGLKKVFPGEESAHYTLFRFIRYALLGFWTSWAAPKLFIKFGAR